MIVPVPWLIASVLAAAIHEAAHFLMILITGGTIQKISVCVFGTKFHARFPNNAAEFLSAMAGPVGSILLLLLRRLYPRLSLCGLLQGMFNLLPIYPLDGGRMLRCVLSAFLPVKAFQISEIISDIVAFGLLLVSIFAGIFLSVGPVPGIIFLVFLYNRKKTCKQTRIGIQ